MSLAAALARLQAAQAQLNGLDSWDEENRERFPDHCASRLMACDLGGTLAVEYHGECWDDAWDIVQAALADPRVAPRLAVLRLTGPDEGANGLREWDFAALLEQDVRFAALRYFHLRPTQVHDHNHVCVQDDQLPLLLARMPILVEATLPQPPEPAFFDLPLASLHSLRTGMAHRTHGFVAGLARAQGLPALRAIDFSDSLAFTLTEAQPPDWSATPFEDYRALFASPLMGQVRSLRLRNAVLSEAQFHELQRMRPDCQFSVALEAPHVYVAHWGQERFSHRHLLLA